MIPPVMFAMACTSALVAVVMFALWRQGREAYLGLWGVAIAIQGVRHAIGTVAELTGQGQAVLPVILVTLLSSGLVHLAGTYRLLGRSISWGWVAGAVAVFTWTVTASSLGQGFLETTLPAFLFVGTVDIVTGVALLRAPLRSTGRLIAGTCFVLWGLHRMNFPFLRPDTDFAPWGFALAIVLATGVAVGLVLLHLEHSAEQNRALRDQLLHSQKMQAIGQLAGGVAHDFNNLLTAILASAELARVRLDAREDPGPDLDTIRDAAVRGADLTGQLLAFSSRQVVAPRRIELARQLGSTERILARLLPATVTLEVQARGPAWVDADPALIDQVVVNLAVNARDALPQGGRIGIRLERVDGQVVLEVEDDGGGIPEAVLPRIFEPFFTTKELGKGTGLGLATVFGAVQQLGGAIEVDNRPGDGVTFRVRLPSVAPPPLLDEPQRPPEERPTSDGPLRVLVVEDDDDIRDILVQVLAGAGYAVEAPAMGALDAALDRAREFDLLVSDVVLPGASGPELAERFRADRPEAPVLLVSGYPRGQLDLEGPHTRFLAKPFRPSTLLGALRDLIRPRGG